MNFSQNYLTDVGAYASSTSPYGTFDQGGNAWEWTEATISGYRGMSGGSWRVTSVAGHAATRHFFEPNYGSFNSGFRVATVPEPSSFVLAAFGLIGLVAWKRRRQ